MNSFFLLLLLSSCSFFIGTIDSPIIDSELYKKNIPVRETYCSLEKKVQLQLVGTNRYAQESFQKMVDHPQLKGLDFFDHFALWSLIQFSIRPDQSSPNSRLQTLFHYKDQTFYFDFYSDKSKDQYPYLYAIEWILKKFGKTTKLEFYAKILEGHLKGSLRADKDLEGFLGGVYKSMKNDPVLSAYFIRGNEVLKENESVPFLRYSEVIRHYRLAESSQFINVKTDLTPFDIKGVKGNCNYDFNLYENSIFLIDKTSPSSNIFGMAKPHMSFLSSSSLKIEEILPFKELPIFQGSSKVRSAAVCSLDNQHNKIWTFSTSSRDPGQHLFHIFKYGLHETKSTFEVDKLIKHSRHLFLSDPVRLVIESLRSTQSQIDNLLKLNLPIYNADALGNVWAYTSFGEQNRFIIDDRNSGTFLCK